MTNTDKRAGWDRVPGTTTIDNGKGKQYRNMVRYERPCAACGERFGVYVTQSTADGEARNSSFGLRNCEKHRMKMVSAGSGGSIEEVNKLRSANTTMKAELEGLYVVIKELREQLAKYELAPAIERIAAPQSLGDHMMKVPDPAGDELRRKFVAKNNVKMPWEGA